MKTREDAVKAMADLITGDEAFDLEAELGRFWDQAAERAEFDRQMAVLAYRYAQAVDRIGPSVVAERIGITVEELARRIHPSYFEEITMSELRMLSIAAEVVVDYEVIPKNVPPTNEGD